MQLAPLHRGAGSGAVPELAARHRAGQDDDLAAGHLEGGESQLGDPHAPGGGVLRCGQPGARLHSGVLGGSRVGGDRAAGDHAEVGLFTSWMYKLNAVHPELESAWFQPLNLWCDILVSKFAFQMGQLVPLRRAGGSARATSTGLRAGSTSWWGCVQAESS
jgi:hypothetical protein